MSKKANKAEGFDDYFKSYTDEPHCTRRKQILEKHPEIAKLFAPDPRPIPFVIALVVSQLVLAYYARSWSWPLFFFVAWSWGGTATHALSLMTHEISHNLVFESISANEYFGIFCNLGMGLPSSCTFKRYHMEHHQFQGQLGMDVDIPTDFEGRFFRGIFLKTLFVACQSLFYSVRPAIVRPKSLTKIEVINYAVVLSFDACIVYNFGIKMFAFMIASLLLGMGLHPVAGHFISEHYVFVPGAETYSYYGILNLLCWNVGYHNEHHDFPRVPGWKLPEVRRIAPEFYDSLPQHESWVGVLWNFITDPKMTLYSRTTRASKIKKSD
jgi:sphingolipid delta-4 desaturase